MAGNLPAGYVGRQELFGFEGTLKRLIVLTNDGMKQTCCLDRH